MCGPNAFSARTHAAGAKVTDVARRNDVATNLLQCWHLADVEGPLCANSSRRKFLLKGRDTMAYD
jgi:hypothetical protein